MKKWNLILLVTLISFKSVSQNKDSLCREFQKDTFYVKIASYLDLHKGDTLADIGAGEGYTILRIAHYTPGVIFFEEDLNRWVTNRVIFNSTNRKTCTKVDLKNFKFFRGTPTSTEFKDQFFKKVFIAFSFHEFEFKIQMIKDVKRIMKPDGKLYILEPFFKELAQKDKQCNFPYTLKSEFIPMMEQCGFKLLKEISLDKNDLNENEANANPQNDSKNRTGSFFVFEIKQ